MILLIIALTIAIILIFVDQENIKQTQFNYNIWLRKKYQPGWKPELEEEQELQQMLNNPKEYWKKYL